MSAYGMVRDGYGPAQCPAGGIDVFGMPYKSATVTPVSSSYTVSPRVDRTERVVNTASYYASGIAQSRSPSISEVRSSQSDCGAAAYPSNNSKEF